MPALPVCVCKDTCIPLMLEYENQLPYCTHCALALGIQKTTAKTCFLISLNSNTVEEMS